MLLVASSHDLDEHDPGGWHPEQFNRLEAAVAALRDPRFTGAIDWMAPRRASRHELEAVHDSGYLNAVIDLCASGGGSVDPDTFLSAGTWETACFTAGAGLSAIEGLLSGRGDAAIALGRPPGHHAGRDRAMGFCVVNNVAVAAAALTGRGERVAIVDWDVHHGNGTQDIFWSDPGVLYVSVHQWPFYPGTGLAGERGEGAALGTNLNLPMPARTAGDAYRTLFDEVVLPAVEHFRPGWVLVSAGFDAHRDDPLGDMLLSAGDYADLTARLMSAAPERRLVLFLEGGYDPAAVQLSVGACAARLLGELYRPEPPSSGDGGIVRALEYRGMFDAEVTP
jgi:acetoin utilization deacetylase AcuC-like enzyme